MNNYQSKEDGNFTNTRSRQRERRFLDLAESLLADMSGRSGEIVKKRYGLHGGQRETLESIGAGYSITRERVRQIIAEATKRVAQKMDHLDFLEAEEKIIFTINRNNGIIKESEVAGKFTISGDKEANAIKFLAGVSGKIFEVEEKGVLEKVWVVSLDSAVRAKKVIAEAEKILEEEKRLLRDEEILEKLGERGFLHPESEVIGYLEAAASIRKNKVNKWGLVHWKEVSPKGTRDKVYLVLKENKKPLHFTEIAKLIDKYKLGKRKAHPQTVHNELIKDDRFVLIGRGIYALKEWGYFEGTIREVLERILAKSAKPLSKEEILDKVLKMRRVKKRP
jgi:hypothetical protein